jgi:hypothetical protein
VNNRVDTDETAIKEIAMTNGDDDTMKIALAIGAVLLLIWAARMAIIALK